MKLHVLGAGSVHGRTIEWPETLFADVEVIFNKESHEHPVIIAL